MNGSTLCRIWMLTEAERGSNPEIKLNFIIMKASMTERTIMIVQVLSYLSLIASANTIEV